MGAFTLRSRAALDPGIETPSIDHPLAEQVHTIKCKRGGGVISNLINFDVVAKEQQ